MTRSASHSATKRRRRSADAAPNTQRGGPRSARSGAGKVGAENDVIGRLLSGRFRIEHLIGTGSMGVVYAARHIQLDTRVAIKGIRPEQQLLPDVVARFAREAKAAVVIRSEHVAQVFDVGTDAALGPYIVMEYLEGRDLRTVLELEGRIPVRRAVDYVLQACEALAAAHANGVIHRDIKPENLFLSRQGELELLKLLDFGISKAALTGHLFGGQLSAEESPCLLGTPLYMSPEQIHSLELVDQRADIWSLGAVLYELVTGRSAYSATDSLPELLKNILETSPAPLAEGGAEVEPGLQGIIDLCLEKNPARRFQNVADLAYALLPFASSRARRHAQRAAALLGTREASQSAAEASPIPLQQPAARPLSAQSSRPAALSNASALRKDASGARAPLPAAAPRSLRLALFAGAAVAVLAAVAIATRGTSGFRVHAEPVAAVSSTAVASAAVASAAVAPAAVTPAALAAEEPVPAVPVSRTVLVESQPSGAAVKIEGQVIGITPLSTLLPPSTVTLSLEKPGYAKVETLLQVEAAGPGARPIHRRVVLQQAPSQRSGAPATSRATSRATPPRKAVPAKGRSTTSQRAERPRLRLVQDPPAKPGQR